VDHNRNTRADHAAYRSMLEDLRMCLHQDSKKEYPVVGVKAIADWFVMIGFRNRPPCMHTINRWRRAFDLPVTRNRSGHEKGNSLALFTTNLMLHAWIGTLARRMRLGRTHPLRLAAEGWPMQPHLVRRAKRHPVGGPPEIPFVGAHAHLPSPGSGS